ncbi:glycosyltransferase [candidate division TA06 bacterium]|uniref:Glycosyltransferase n=1 Tax=candidate division TA06 bacterium TaxID=2250710 RepID=A0A933MJX6_UNCT6|nr:glycosyltransferase [candidate division TA06 bacterium]
MKKILIISASAGAGHTMAAKAIEQSLAGLPQRQERCQVTHIDLLKYSTLLYKTVYHDIYLYMAQKQPLLFGYIFTTSDNLKRQNRPDFLLRLLDTLNTRKFTSFIKEQNWGLIISTHFLASQLVCALKRKGKIGAPLLTVTTDYGLHSYWILPECEHYSVADQNSRQHLMASGLLPERIQALGIPVGGEFAKKKPLAPIREKLVLAPQLPSVLMLSGGFGVGPIEKMVASLTAVKSNFQLMVIAGKNRRLLSRLRQMREQLPFKMTAIGYTEQMDEYMRASDILISKPGGLTTAEALACGLPMIIVNPIPGQEDMNSDMLLEHGAGIKAMHQVDIPHRLDEVLASPQKLSSLRKNALKLGRPRAAQNIAKLVEEILD